MDENTIIELLKTDNAYELGKIYVKTNWYKSINLSKVYDAVKEIDNPSVLNFKGFLYIIGVVFDVDDDLAKECIQISADLGDPNAQSSYGAMLCSEGRYRTALYYLKQSVAQKCPLAYNNIVRLYLVSKRPKIVSFNSRKSNIQRSEKVDPRDIITYEEGLDYLTKSYVMGCGTAEANIKELYNSYSHGENTKMMMYQSKKVCLLEEENMKLKDEIEALKKKNKQLELENADLKYRPSGVGYEEAKVEFESFCD